MRHGIVPAVFVALAAIACGVITLQPEPTAPVNVCTDDPSCGKTFPEAGVGSCTGGACSAIAFNPFVVVAMPADQTGLGGVTMPLPASYAQVRGQLAGKGALPTAGPCLNAQQAAPTTECDPTPPLATFSDGRLLVAVGFDSTLIPGGLRPNNSATSGTATTLPVNVSVELLWQDPATLKFVPARKLGIALDDVVGLLQTSTFLPSGPTSSDATVPGFAFGANVPQPLSPKDPSNAYRLYLVPPDPYAAIPPFTFPSFPQRDTLPLTVPIASPGFAPVGAPLPIVTYDTPTDGGTVVPHTYQINEAPSAPSLEGWTLHVDDQNGHRVSGSVVLPAGASKTVTLYEATGTGVQNETLAGPDRYSETLYIDPPSGTHLPRFFAGAAGLSIVGPFTYPALPSQVSRSGFVRTADTLEFETAQIMFVANGSDDAILEADLTTPATFWSQSWSTTTSAAGEWSLADIYPGTFRAYVVPDDPNFALTVTDQQIGPSGGPGATLFVNPRTHVKGRVVLPNAMPVYAAEVVISPSADSPFLPKDDPLARPREVRGTTDTTGLFDIPSDPGFVDISIRPRDGTSFPWVVLTHRVVPPNTGSDAGAQVTLSISDVVIPEPSRYTQAASGVLTDSVGNPIVHAVVRAYAFPSLGTGVDGGAPQTRGARLLGMTVTDDNAKFQLFVVPPQ